MEARPQIPADREGSPVHVLRGRIQSGTLDTFSPILGLAIGFIGGALAIWLQYYAYQLLGRVPPETGVGAWAIAILFGILCLVFVVGRRSTQDELAVYDDRIVLHPCWRGRSGPSLTIVYRDLERLALEKSWIRLRQTNGRRWSFKAPRLCVGDSFDVIAEKVDAANPRCSVQNP